MAASRRVDVAAKVAEVGCVCRRAVPFDGTDADGVADAGRCLETPRDASALRIERVDVAGVGAEEDAAPGDRRLPVHRRRVRQTECPLQFEIGHLRRGDAGGLRRLEARVGRVGAPAVPRRACGRIGQLRIRSALIRHRLRITGGNASDLSPADELGAYHASRCRTSSVTACACAGVGFIVIGRIDRVGRQLAQRPCQAPARRPPRARRPGCGDRWRNAPRNSESFPRRVSRTRRAGAEEQHCGGSGEQRQSLRHGHHLSHGIRPDILRRLLMIT